MEPVISQPAWNDETLAQHLLAVSGSEQINQIMRDWHGTISPSVIRLLKDEVARLIHSDIHRAMELAEQIRAVAAFCENSVGIALAHHASALAMHFAGRYTEALGFYGQAEAIYMQLGDEVEAARINRAVVDVLMFLSEYERALEVAARARAVFQKHDQPILLAQLETNVGNIYHRLDRYQEALKFYRRAGDIFADHQDEKALAFIDYNCANQYTCLDDFEQALALYQQAGRVLERLDLPLAFTNVEYSIAWLYFRRSQFHESLRLFTKVRDRARELGDLPLEALCDLDLSEVYLQLNAYEDAIESARSAVEKFEALQRSYEHIKARMYMGIAYTHLNDLTAAERELQEARRGFLAEGNEVFAALTDIYLSDIAMRQGDWSPGIEFCAEAQQIFSQQGLTSKAACAELQLARLKLCSGQVDEARQLCQSAVDSLGEVEAPWLKHQGFQLLGNAMERIGQVTEAYRYYQQSVDYLENLRSSIWVDEYKCAFLKDKLRVYEDLVQLCLRAGTAEKVEEALFYAESAKSRALMDLLVTNRGIESKASEGATAAIHQEWQDVREQLNWFYSRINECEQRAQGRPDQVINHLRQEAHQREQTLTKLIRRMQIEDAEYTSLQTVTHPDIALLRQSLAADEVLVEYYTVSDQVKVFVVSPESVRVFEDVTTISTIAPLLRRLKFYFDKFTLSRGYVDAHQDKIQLLTDQVLGLLYTQLVGPIDSLLEGKKVYFVPHGMLHYIPFHALHDGRQYLIDRQEISCCPSASVLKLCKEKAQKKNTDGRVLVMGVPDEATPLISSEVEMVQSLYGDAQVFMGSEATLDRLKQSAPGARLVHLASHGVFRRDNPMFSALKLSDGWLNFYDIFNLNLNADLVTLSACETGMNEIFPGDELFGLMRGFLYAGVPSLIVSLWVVNDRSTAAFMRRLYTGLHEGLSKRAALRQAQLAVKEEYPHPYYWAPFMLMGAP